MPTKTLLSGGLALCLLISSAFAAATAKQLWTAKLPGDAKWHSITGLGTLVVGTADAMAGFDPETGQQLWIRNEFKKSSPHNAREIPGTPFLMCHTAEGLGGQKTTLFQIDYTTGQNVWQTPELGGQYLGTIPVIEKGFVILLINSFGTDGKEPGIYLKAHDLLDGKEKWSAKFAKGGAIPLHIADNSGKFIPTMDLSGYHDPVVEGDVIYLPYLGCHAVDLNSGAIKWAAEFPSGDKGFKKTYAPLRIQGDRIYGAGGGSVIAIDKNTGAILWKSDRISAYAGLLKARDNALVSQLEVVGDKVVARYGGYFSNGQQVMLREPLGVIALHAADGKDFYNFDKAKEGITNLVVLPESKTMVFADGANVYGIDAAGATPAEAFKTPIEFKRKMGMGGVAKIGLGALGGVTGLVKGAVAANKGLLDVPVSVHVAGSRVVVQGKQHLLSFDPQTKTAAWSLFYAAPSEAFGNIAMFAVTAAAALYGNAQVAASGSYSGASSGVNTIQSSLDRYYNYTEKAAKRAGQSKATAAYTYILTSVEKDIGVVGVNLATGETDRQLLLKEKEPVYQVDEPMNRVFHFKGKNTIIAYQF
jgi:outer membrane protein assembly factor BamB